jgi:hypothetical protein
MKAPFTNARACSAFQKSSSVRVIFIRVRKSKRNPGGGRQIAYLVQPAYPVMPRPHNTVIGPAGTSAPHPSSASFNVHFTPARTTPTYLIRSMHSAISLKVPCRAPTSSKRRWLSLYHDGDKAQVWCRCDVIEYLVPAVTIVITLLSRGLFCSSHLGTRGCAPRTRCEPSIAE